MINSQGEGISLSTQVQEFFNYKYNNNNENQQNFQKPVMTHFKTTCWILRIQIQDAKSFQLKAELCKVFNKQFKIDTQILKIMILRFINKINQQCQTGQFYLNMENGKICYKINLLIQNKNYKVDSLISLSKRIMNNDFKKYLFLILERGKFCSPFHQLEQQQSTQNQIQTNFVFQNLTQNFELFNQINEFGIFKKKLINKNYYSLKFILKQLDGNKIKLQLYKTEYGKIEQNNLKKIGFFIQINNIPPNCIFNKYLQVYFYQNNDFYYLKNQYYSLEQYLIEQSIKLSLSTKLFTLLNIAKGISFIHQFEIIHSYINLQSIFVIPKYRTSPFIGNLEKAYCEMTQKEYEYHNFIEYTPPELKNKILKYPNKKTDIYQFGILMLSFIFEIYKVELNNFRLELFEQRIFSSGHLEIMSKIYNLFTSCLQEDYYHRLTIEEVIQTLKQIIEKLEIQYQTLYLLDQIS